MPSGFLQALSYGVSDDRTATVASAFSILPTAKDGKSSRFVAICAVDYMYVRFGAVGETITATTGTLIAPGIVYVFNVMGNLRMYRLRHGGSDVDFTVSTLENA